MKRSELKQLIREMVEEMSTGTELYFFRDVEMRRTYKRDVKFFGIVTPRGTVEKFVIGDANLEVPVGADDSAIKQALQQKYGRSTDSVDEIVEKFSVLHKGEEAQEYKKSRGAEYDRLKHLGS
jgi:hypothetical protein